MEHSNNSGRQVVCHRQGAISIIRGRNSKGYGEQTQRHQREYPSPIMADQRDLAINLLAQEAHLRARQHTNVLRDLSLRVQPTEGPFTDGKNWV